MNVTLYTRDGQPVVEVDIPPFQTMPEILIWGARFFVWNGERYVEGLAWWCEPLTPIYPANWPA